MNMESLLWALDLLALAGLCYWALSVDRAIAADEKKKG